LGKGLKRLMNDEPVKKKRRKKRKVYKKREKQLLTIEKYAAIDPDKVYDTNGVARVLGICPRHSRWLAKNNKFPFEMKKFGSRYKVLGLVILRYMDPLYEYVVHEKPRI